VTYKVRTSGFEGPFDLLLHLVSRQRLDINSISVVAITDQYLEHVERMKELDLDVASDFLLVAATLLEIKVASLLPKDAPMLVGDEYDDLSPEEAKNLLVTRLLKYMQFKNVALELMARHESEMRTHRRHAPLEEPFSRLLPDFLAEVTLHNLAVTCAELVYRREAFILAADHVASMPLSLESRCRALAKRLIDTKRLRFQQLVEESNGSPEVVVVTLLAVLEFYKRGIASVQQDEVFGDILIQLLDADAAMTPIDIEEEE